MDRRPSPTAQRTLRRTGVLVPVVLLSASWTVSVAGTGGAPTAVPTRDASVAEVAPPLAVAVPEAEVSPPASVARFGRATGGRGPLPAVAGADVSIPPAALAAYQRASVVIGAADEDCHLEWPLVAAIGHVESDHGRTGGGRLDPEGVARPAIVGVRLDGRRGTARISDTDGGRYDGDKAFDRAVGPMQFVPTTWGVVGVDADGDGVRNPQDVDDAALASAVYLCSGDVDLDRPAHLRRAVHRYNQSDSYMATVIATMRSYAAGSVVPVAPHPTGVSALPAAQRDEEGSAQAARHPGAASAGRAQQVEPAPRPASPTPSGPAEPEPPRTAPVTALLTRSQAFLECTLRGLTRLLAATAFDGCVAELTGTDDAGS